MSTVTAHALIGKADSWHGGIRPTHAIYLNENFRPVLTLLRQDLPPRLARMAPPVVWIPSVDCMLEDLMLMAYLFVIRDASVRLAAAPILQRRTREPLWILEVQKEHALDPLRERCHQAHTEFKIQLTVARDSTLYNQLPVLEQYDVDLEVYIMVYRHEASGWDGEIRREGVMPGESSK